MATRLSEKEYKQKMLKLGKIEKSLDKKRKQLLEKKLDPQLDAEIKMNAMNSLLGFLLRKGLEKVVPMNILIDIANDYEKRSKGD